LTYNRFWGALLYNFAGLILPDLYGTLSELWVARIDSSMVVTVYSYTYIGVVAEVINKGLPRAAWMIIGDKSSRPLSSRIGLIQTLILFPCILGLAVSVVILCATKQFAAGFVPVEVHQASLTHVRISAFSVFTIALEVAVSVCRIDSPWSERQGIHPGPTQVFESLLQYQREWTSGKLQLDRPRLMAASARPTPMLKEEHWALRCRPPACFTNTLPLLASHGTNFS
jgi:hypothetical protein